MSAFFFFKNFILPEQHQQPRRSFRGSAGQAPAAGGPRAPPIQGSHRPSSGSTQQNPPRPSGQNGYSELKTEEGYSSDIVRTYIPGDICSHNVRTTSHEGYMSAQCPHNLGTMSALCQHILRYMSHEGDVVRKLCEHISPGIYVRTMSALYPSSVFSSGILVNSSI